MPLPLRPRVHAALLHLVLVVGLLAPLLTPPIAATATFPGAAWEVAARPEDRGFSTPQLARAREHADKIKTAALMVVHDGVVVAQWGEVERKFNTHSLRKSFLAFLYGRYVRDGTIKLDATMAEFGIDDTLGLTAEEKRATVRDLLKARSGVYHPALYESSRMKKLKPARHAVPAGTHWYYNNWDFNVAGTLYEKFSGRGIFDAIRDDLATPLGMQDYTPADGNYVTGEESVHRAYPFRISARDLARFGLLALRRGEWNGKQIIDSAWIDECTRYHSDAALYSSSGYGYMWWIARDFNKFPHLPHATIPEGSYSGRGSGGHHLLVIPAYDLVIVHRANTDTRGHEVGSSDFGRLVQLILAARTSRDLVRPTIGAPSADTPHPTSP